MLIARAKPVVANPTTDVIDLPAPVIGLTCAPIRGAYPVPPVAPSETMTPPLGNWFIFTSDSET